MLTALLLGVTIALLQTTTPTPQTASTELAALLTAGLGIAGSALEQLVKKALVPFDNASPAVKAIITFAWGLVLAWVGGKMPVLAAALPSDPHGLGVALNGLMLTLVMMGVHKLGQVTGVTGAPTP